MRFLWLLTAMLSIGWFGAAHACECATYGSCHRLELKDTTFVGTAMSEAVAAPQTKEEGTHRVYEFFVIESFTGQHHAGEVVSVTTGMGGGDCGIGFDVGSRYLVDAHEYGKELHTSICTVTASERRGMATIRELRTLVAGGRVPDLSGRIAVASSEAYPLTGNSRSLTGIPVHATALKSGKVFRSVTDADGLYTFDVLPAGEYKVELLLPVELTTRHTMNSEVIAGPVKIAVPEAVDSGAACQQEIDVYPTGMIAGRIVDATGQGVAGTVYAYPSPSEAPLDRHQWASMGKVEANGNFAIPGLRKGSYQVMFEYSPPFDGNWAHRKALKFLYYPGVEAMDKGARVYVTEGKSSQPIRFVLPEGFRE